MFRARNVGKNNIEMRVKVVPNRLLPDEEILYIDEDSFPDEVFREYVLNNIAKDGQDWLTEAERCAVSIIDVDRVMNDENEYTAPAIKSDMEVRAFFSVEILSQIEYDTK